MTHRARGIFGFGLALAVTALLPVPAPAMETFYPDGAFTEPATGMTFPVAIGDFARVDVTKYNPDGTDESAGYNRGTPGSEIAMTVYVFPSLLLTSIGSPQNVIDGARAEQCRMQFDGIKREVMGAHSDAEFLSEADVSLAQLGTDFAGHKAVYRLPEHPWFGRSQETRSEVYVYCYAGGKWTVEYRVDYPSGADADGAVFSFMRDLEWTINPQP